MANPIEQIVPFFCHFHKAMLSIKGFPEATLLFEKVSFKYKDTFDYV